MNADHPPRLLVGARPSELISVKILVSDIAASLDFYLDIAGLKIVEFPTLPAPVLDDPDASVVEVVLNPSGSPRDAFLVLLWIRGSATDPAHTRGTVVGVKVPDLDAAVERVRAAGTPVEIEPFEVYGMRVIVVRDPDGYQVQFSEVEAAPA